MNWVFDLDNTIYNTNNLDYRTIHTDYYLRCLLKSLEGKKYIFTNATIGHARIVLKQLGILDIFEDIIDRNKMSSLKPQKEAFNYFIRNTNIKGKVIFFEDTIDNLISAKRNYGWITVLLYPKIMRQQMKLNRNIDYIYKDIHTALENFSFNPGKCYTLK